MIKKFISFILVLTLLCAIGAAAYAAEAKPEETAEPAAPSVEAQLDFVAENQKLWVITDSNTMAPYVYAVTDLDGNGRLEVLADCFYSSGNLTRLAVMEINEDCTGFEAYGSGVRANFSELYDEPRTPEQYEDFCTPDIYSFVARDFSEEQTELTCLRDRESGAVHYIIENFNRSGSYIHEDIIQDMTLENGRLTQTPLAKIVTVSPLDAANGETEVSFKNTYGRPISEEEFPLPRYEDTNSVIIKDNGDKLIKAFDVYENCEAETAVLRWIHVPMDIKNPAEATNLEEISASYEAFSASMAK